MKELNECYSFLHNTKKSPIILLYWNAFLSVLLTISLEKNLISHTGNNMFKLGKRNLFFPSSFYHANLPKIEIVGGMAEPPGDRLCESKFTAVRNCFAAKAPPATRGPSLYYYASYPCLCLVHPLSSLTTHTHTPSNSSQTWSRFR